MKLIFLYGAPATGKLTVAKTLAALTGYKLHHNHMAVDLALDLFDYADPHLMRLCERLHLDVFDIADQANLPGVIFTLAGDGSSHAPFFAEVIRRFQGNVFFVHLSCEIEELKRRVTNPERRQHRKAVEASVLLEFLKRFDCTKDIAHPHHLAIDTTALPPEAAAARIVDQFGL
jgi:shikimate kinase